jgi:hypothetical protein
LLQKPKAKTKERERKSSLEFGSRRAVPMNCEVWEATNAIDLEKQIGAREIAIGLCFAIP